jgi:hypothetical protein
VVEPIAFVVKACDMGSWLMAAGGAPLALKGVMDMQLMQPSTSLALTCWARGVLTEDSRTWMFSFSRLCGSIAQGGIALKVPLGHSLQTPPSRPYPEEHCGKGQAAGTQQDCQSGQSGHF